MESLFNDFSPGLFIVSTLLLLALIALMVKFAWKPILNAIQEREEGIMNALDAAENAKKEMENLTADNERLLNEAR
ncbi:MAG: F0F1 ATP synthase subunit B, partial [Flavobacteriaceae bacterium]